MKKVKDETPAELISAWIFALRSGLYKQGKGYLCYVPEGGTEECYCALGVLCDIANLPSSPAMVSFPDRKSVTGYGTSKNILDRSNFALPVNFARALGMGQSGDFWCKDLDLYRTSNIEEFLMGGAPPKKSSSIVALSDAGISFDEIADFIEDNSKAVLSLNSQTSVD